MSHKPDDSPFKQQKLKAWQPIMTPQPVIITFLVIGVVFIPLGFVLFSASESVVEVQSETYENACQLNTECTLKLTLPYMKAPVFFYYRLENFFQNHRRYVKSRNDDQLRGLVKGKSDLLDCEPYASINGSSDSNLVYVPCGLAAKSMFNDTFFMLSPNGTYVNWTSDGIAWESDVKNKFNNPPENSPGVRTIANFKDPEFVVWMRNAAFPNFRKLHRIIKQDIQPGTYTILVKNYYPVLPFGGRKSVVLSTTSWLGGKNPFLGYAYMVVGGLCLFLGIAFAVKHLINGRRQGDTSYLEWSR